MKSILFVLTLALLLIFSACTHTKKPSSLEAKKTLLKAELSRWENFKAEGITQMNYLGLGLRKSFVLSKTADELRFDVVDGGIFGSAGPLISLYFGDYFSVRSDFQPQLAIMAASMVDGKIDVAAFKDIHNLAELYMDEIIHTGKVQKDGWEISFSPQMQLQSITNAKDQISTTFSYTKKGDPDIILMKMKSASIELLFDSVNYGVAKVVPLPSMNGNKSILNQFLEHESYDEFAAPEEE